MAVAAAKVEVVAVGKAAVAVEEVEEMAAPVAVVALVSSFLYVLRCNLSKTENSSLRRIQYYTGGRG